MLQLRILALTFLLSGCISSEEMSFTVVSVDGLDRPFILLKEGVKGEDCTGMYGSYQKATERAIDSVPGATALANAKFSKAEKITIGICARVKGDAIAL